MSVVATTVGSRRQWWLLSLVLFAVGYSAQGVSPVMLLYTRELGLSTTMLTVFFTVYAVGLMVAFLIVGQLSDRRGRKAVVVPSIYLLIVSLVALLGAAAWGEPMILAARFVQGLASGAVFTIGTVWLRELAGDKHAASAAVCASAAQALGFGVGPLVSSFMVQWLPLEHILTILVIVALLVAGLLIARRLPETMTERRSGRIQIGLPPGTGRGFVWYSCRAGSPSTRSRCWPFFRSRSRSVRQGSARSSLSWASARSWCKRARSWRRPVQRDSVRQPPDGWPGAGDRGRWSSPRRLPGSLWRR